MNTLVTIVVPAKNEAAAIGRTLRTLPLETLRAEGFDYEVVVLDGRSQDATATIARRLGAIVVTDHGRGKGRALRDARRHFRGEYIVMLDADGSYASDAIPRLLEPIIKGEADITMGDRQPRPGSMSGLHRLGNAVLSLQASLLYGRACRDVCTGLWGFRATALRLLPLRSQGFELEAELFSLAARMGLKVQHVPVDYLPREGETKLSASRDGIRIGWCLLSTRFRALPQETGGPAEVEA